MGRIWGFDVRQFVFKLYYSNTYFTVVTHTLKIKISNRIAVTYLVFQRRLRDSNPRYGFPYTHFPGVLLQPLGQVSIFERSAKIKVQR